MAGGLELKYDFTALDQCAANIDDVIKVTGLITLNITSIGKRLDRCWEGEANKAYIERYNALLEKIQKLRDEMTENKNKLTTAVDKYRTNEQKQLKNVNSLSDEDIF